MKKFVKLLNLVVFVLKKVFEGLTVVWKILQVYSALVHG